MISLGMPSKKVRAMRIVNGICNAASGRITAISSLYRSKFEATTKSGVSSTASGTVRATSRAQNQISFPKIRSLEKPKAASIVSA
jgi:hypothetical protein